MYTSVEYKSDAYQLEKGRLTQRDIDPTTGSIRFKYGAFEHEDQYLLEEFKDSNADWTLELMDQWLVHALVLYHRCAQVMVNFSEKDMGSPIQLLVERVFDPTLDFFDPQLKPNFGNPASEYDFVSMDIVKLTQEIKTGADYLEVKDMLGGYQHKGHTYFSQVIEQTMD